MKEYLLLFAMALTGRQNCKLSGLLPLRAADDTKREATEQRVRRAPSSKNQLHSHDTCAPSSSALAVHTRLCSSNAAVMRKLEMIVDDA